MRSSFDTMLGILYGVIEERYTDGTDMNRLYARIQKLINDIITLYNSEELDYREYKALNSTALIIKDQIKNKLKNGGT